MVSVLMWRKENGGSRIVALRLLKRTSKLLYSRLLVLSIWVECKVCRLSALMWRKGYGKRQNYKENLEIGVGVKSFESKVIRHTFQCVLYLI